MKTKQRIAFMGSILMTISLFAGCGAAGTMAVNEDTAQISNSITLINSKGEVAGQIENLAAAYEAETGNHVEVITTPAGVDAMATIKGLYLSDQMPDIIVSEAANFANWDGLLLDLSDQEWTNRTEAAFVDDTYGTLGFPYATEAIGLAYNADILKKAGIEPASLTSPEAYQVAFEKIDSMKEELGLNAVVGYCAEPNDLGWSSGNHIFGAYLDSGLSRDDTTYIDMFNEGGKIDQTRGMEFASFIGMLNTYSDPELLTTGTYGDQVKNFAAGKYAFVTQGSWIGAVLTGDNAAEYQAAGSFEIGMAPYAFSNGIDTILTSSPSWWAVAKEGNTEIATDFLQWCSEDAGQKILVEEAGFVSPFSDCKFVASDPFAGTIASYISAGKTSSWHWMNMKEGIGQSAICFCFGDFASGLTDEAGFLAELQKASSDYYSK